MNFNKRWQNNGGVGGGGGGVGGVGGGFMLKDGVEVVDRCGVDFH